MKLLPKYKFNDDSCKVLIEVQSIGKNAIFDPLITVSIDHVIPKLAKGVSASIDDCLSYLQDLYLEIEQPEQMTAKALVEYFKQRSNLSAPVIPDFYEFATQIANEMTSKGKRRGNDIMIVVRSLKDFKPKTLAFNQMDLRFIAGYKEYICNSHVTKRRDQFGRVQTIERKGISTETFNDRLRIIRSIINKAKVKYNINDYVVRDAIFGNIRVNRPVPKRHDRALGVDVIQRMIDWKPLTDKQGMARSLFLFSFFMCGMNAKDIYDLPRTSMDGSYLSYLRAKTKDKRIDQALTKVKVSKAVLELIKPFMSTEGEFLFNVRQKYKSLNNFQHALSDGLIQTKRLWKFDGTLQFYAARHSFANIACNILGVDRSVVSLCLNHSLPQNSTSRYIKPDYSQIWDTQQLVLDHVMGNRHSLLQN